MNKKKFKDLNLSNAFLFAAALNDEEICALVLQLILGKEFKKVTVKTEHSILFNSDFRSVRLDVYATDEVEVGYDLEMETLNHGNIPKRSRYYQAELDVTSLKPGEDFNALKPSYIIFICMFDPFGDGLYQYTFEERCIENGRPLGDGTVKIFLNAKGKNADEVPKELVDFLKYITDSTETCVNAVADDKIQKLHEKVSCLKQSRTMEGNFMHLSDWIKYEIKDGIAEGLEAAKEEFREEFREEVREEVRAECIAEGRADAQEQMLQLFTMMIQDNLQDEIPKLANDPSFLAEMLKKYHLDQEK